MKLVDKMNAGSHYERDINGQVWLMDGMVKMAKASSTELIFELLKEKEKK